MPYLKKIIRFACLAVFTAGFIGMFLPTQESSGQTGSRLMTEIWITGHILIFFLGAYLFYSFNPRFKNRLAGSQILFVLLAALAASLAIEAIQTFIPGRYPSIRDMAANIAGVLLYLSFIHRRISAKLLPLHASAIALTALLLYPVFVSAADRVIADARFPVLADFETPLEKTRFRGNRSLLKITDKHAFQGNHSLQMDFTTQIYSTHSLSYIPGNWKEYSHLKAAVYNPGQKQVKLHIRIEDTQHTQAENQQYTDRYNSSFILPPGKWQKISIPLNEIKNAPKNRKMDMEQISSIMFFVARQPEPLTLYIDDIRLE